MSERDNDDLWRDFPKTAQEFEARFATEEDCRAYWIEARWGGKPACARAPVTRVWTIRDGTTFECADCGHQTSLTSGTLLEKTHKPLKMWFRAVFEISSRTHWHLGQGAAADHGLWLLQDRVDVAAQAARGAGASGPRATGQHVQIDEAFVGAKRGRKVAGAGRQPKPTAASAWRKRKTTTLKPASASPTPRSQPSCRHDRWPRRLQRQEPRRAAARALWCRPRPSGAEADALQRCALGDLAAEALAVWHAWPARSARKHLQAYLDEYVFRYNRRRTKGVGRISPLDRGAVAARVEARRIARPALGQRAEFVRGRC